MSAQYVETGISMIGAATRWLRLSALGAVVRYESERWGSSGNACAIPEWAGAFAPPATPGTTLHSNGLGQKERHGNIATERVSPGVTRLGAPGTGGTLAQTLGGGPVVRSTPVGLRIRDESVL